ncbi:TorF family putative porin [Massilia sp.]|uniref:TorF family putative porin n=1 Tax=Massilia sp. TaxID=1882437 RepID=UPI0028A5E643|nr:TorF family putative porin [Massilia sp.]
MPLVCLALFSMHLSAHASVPDSAKPVYAADAADAALTANAGVASQYVWRGLRQTDGKPVAQAGIDYVHPSGWSAGTLVSHVGDRTVANGSVEWNLYGGYSGKLGEFGYSLIGHVARYPGAGRGANGARFDYGELSAGVSYKALYAKYNYTVTRNFFGIANARGTGYLDGGANVDVGDATTLNLHAGEGRVAGAGNDYWNWRDAKVGLTRRLDGGWKVAGAYTRAFGASHGFQRDTAGVPDHSERIAYTNPGKNTLVVSLSKTF